MLEEEERGAIFIGNEVTTQLEENLINDVDKTEAEMYQEVLEAGLQAGQTLESLEKIELMVDSHAQNMQLIGELLSVGMPLTQLKLNGSKISTLRDMGNSFKHFQVLWVSRC